MVKAVFERLPGNLLRPIDPAALQLVESLKSGQGIALEAKRETNVQFHKKLIKLLKLGFEIWEPESLEYRGQPVQKNFEAFRKYLVILAGFYDPVYAPDGSVRLVAHSLSFRQTDDLKREQVYRAVLNVVWSRILRHANYRTEAEVDAVVNQLMGFE